MQKTFDDGTSQLVFKAKIRDTGDRNRDNKPIYEHSEQRLMYEARKSDEFRQLAHAGADMHVYTVNSPCGGTASDCSGGIRKFTQEFNVKQAVVMYDDVYDPPNSGIYLETKNTLDRLSADSNFHYAQSDDRRGFEAELDRKNPELLAETKARTDRCKLFLAQHAV